MEFEVEIRKS